MWRCVITALKLNKRRQTRSQTSRSQDVTASDDEGREQDELSRRAGQQAEIQHEGDDLDAVLDDIETTLATNAEEYVSRFVQQGGE